MALLAILCPKCGVKTADWVTCEVTGVKEHRRCHDAECGCLVDEEE